jgi:capsid protein
VRKKIEACFATFVTQPEASEGPALGEVSTSDGQTVETLEPGAIHYLKPGEEVSFAQPSGSGEGYRDFMRDVQTRMFLRRPLDLRIDFFNDSLHMLAYHSI